MKFLTVNTAGTTTEIAYFDGQNARTFTDTDGKKASEVLLLKIDEILSGTPLTDLDCIACVTGPGSFTGIRIGVNTVKAFCYALNLPAVAMTYNYAIASKVDGKTFSVVTGWADNCYVSVYGEDGEEILAPTAMSFSEAESMRNNYPEFELVCDKESADRLNFADKTVIDSADYLIKATARMLVAKQFTPVNEIEPCYAMKSQAERDLEK